MTLRDALTAARRYWVLAVVPMLVLVTGAGILSANAERVYAASSSLFLSIEAGASPSELVQGSTYAQNQILSFAQLATMPVVLEPVIAELDLDTTPRELARQVEVETPRDTVLLEISVRGSDPGEVALITNAIAEQLATVVSEIAPRDEAGGNAVEATVVAPAVESDEPIAPNTRRNLLAALVAGAALGLVLAYLREALDTRIRTADDVERAAQVPVLASVVQVSRPAGGRAPNRAQLAMQDEEFNRLRVNLHTVGLDDVTKCFVFSSSIAGEGKTYSSVRTAMALAAAGSQVLLVDADLRRPTVAQYFGIEGGVGLTDVIIGRVSAHDAVQTVQNNLGVLPAGAVPANPSELLSSRAFATVLAAARNAYDFVLIDSPPVLPVADAIVLAGQATGVVLVVDVTRVKRPQVHEAVHAITMGGGRVVGALLNRTRRPPMDPYVAASMANDVREENVGHRRRGLPAQRSSERAPSAL